MTDKLPSRHPLRRLFAGLVEHVFFVDLGLCDPNIAGYLVDLLSEFVHVDRIFALRDAKGRRLEQVAEMITDAYLGADVAGAERDRFVHKHVGDFTLFWAGVYPEGLRFLRHPMRKDHLVDYLRQGKRSYAIAGQMFGQSDQPPGSVLRRLSEQFEFCVYGLGQVRKSWERHSPDSFRRTRRLWQ